MTAYISATFEKSRLVTSDQIRVIVRNRDDGSVPPQPSVSYYPTQPDDLQNFIVGLFINSVSGTMFARIATLADIGTLPIRGLTTFRDTSADFITAGVQAGDLLSIQLADPELWTSQEYTDINPHIFEVASVIDGTHLTVTRPFPAFLDGCTWSIAAASINGNTGTTLLSGLPANGTEYRTSRYNRLYPTVVESENSVIAMKASMASLTSESAGAGLTTEVVTVSSNI